MGRGGLILLALAACRGAAAEDVPAPVVEDDPRHGIDVPRDWVELPAVAGAARDAAAAVMGKAELHAHAWGDPAAGCYLAVVDVRGTGKTSIVKLRGEVEAAIERSGRDAGAAALAVTEWTSSPDAEDRADLRARFEATAAGTGVDVEAPSGRALAGGLRAHVSLDGRGLPHVVAAACFHNEREPAACDEQCAPILAALASPAPVLPPQPGTAP